jgi:hypothetical protein
MSSFPNFSNIPDYVKGNFNSRISTGADTISLSKLNAWVRVSSGVGSGCILYSNPNYGLFKAAGDSNVGALYGNSSQSGTIGFTWGGGAINVTGENVGKPSPTIDSLEVDEGAGNLSRKANITMTAYTIEQLDELSKYFLEPGFTIFIEFGWNRPEALSGFQSKLSANSVAKYQSFKETNTRRSQTKGYYDNFLGFITGGSVSISGDKWQLSIKCSGFSELPAYLIAAESSTEEKDTPKKPALKYFSGAIVTETDLGRKRFKMMYNELPSNKRTQEVANLINEAGMADIRNYINFDEAVRKKINDKTDGTWWSRNIGEGTTTVKTDGTEAEVPAGTEIVGEEKFIKFSALMQIVGRIGARGYKIGNKEVKFKINSDKTIISAHPQIFSIDKSKLFIPNSTSPNFRLAQANTEKTLDFTQGTPLDNSVNGIQFPKTTNLSGEGTLDEMAEGFSKTGGYWGYLNDLYVNFDFAKGILETKNFVIKDALYQILNGLSSAVNGLWDFQLNEKENDGTTELQIVDLNFAPQTTTEPYSIRLVGTNTFVQDAQFDMDIAGALMNQVIAKRTSGTVLNGSMPEIGNGLFGTEKDQVLNAIERTPVTDDDMGSDDAGESEDGKTANEKNVELFLGRIGYYPKVDLVPTSDFGGDIEGLTYVGAYDDSSMLSTLKMSGDTKQVGSGEVSGVLPIRATVTVHGVSGITRGNKLKIDGLPNKYSENGFFQVVGVKHSISGTQWKTDIEAAFRLNK